VLNGSISFEDLCRNGEPIVCYHHKRAYVLLGSDSPVAYGPRFEELVLPRVLVPEMSQIAPNNGEQEGEGQAPCTVLAGASGGNRNADSRLTAEKREMMRRCIPQRKEGRM
jgi:hypothetical protein